MSNQGNRDTEMYVTDPTGLTHLADTPSLEALSDETTTTETFCGQPIGNDWLKNEDSETLCRACRNLGRKAGFRMRRHRLPAPAPEENVG